MEDFIFGFALENGLISLGDDWKKIYIYIRRYKQPQNINNKLQDTQHNFEQSVEQSKANSAILKGFSFPKGYPYYLMHMVIIKSSPPRIISSIYPSCKTI